MIVTTATKAGPILKTELGRLKDETGKHVNLHIGEDDALFVIRYGSHLISTHNLVTHQQDTADNA